MERRQFMEAMLALFCGVVLPRQREQVWTYSGDGSWSWGGDTMVTEWSATNPNRLLIVNVSGYEPGNYRVTYDGVPVDHDGGGMFSVRGSAPGGRLAITPGGEQSIIATETVWTP